MKEIPVYKNYFCSISMIILLLFIKSNCYANYKKIDAIVAIAENDIILESELVKEAFNIKNNLISNSRKLPDDEIIISQALEKINHPEPTTTKAKNIGLHINDQQLNDAITNIAQRNGLSLADFKLAIEESGKSYLEVRKDIRNDLIIREIQRRNVISNLKITEKEINNFINSEKRENVIR